MNPQDISALIARVEEATGPDRELDEAVALALCDEHWFVQLADAPDGAGWEAYRFGHSAPSSALRVTASLDAALALVERVLPGWEWHVLFNPDHCDGEGCSYAGLNPELNHETGARGPSIALHGRRVPIALLAAMLSALAAQSASDDAKMDC